MYYDFYVEAFFIFDFPTYVYTCVPNFHWILNPIFDPILPKFKFRARNCNRNRNATMRVSQNPNRYMKSRLVVADISKINVGKISMQLRG